MQNTDKQKLKRQIEQEAQQIIKLDGTDLAVSLLATCNGLLKLVERVFSENGNVGITDEVYANYLSFAVRVNHFYEFYAEHEKNFDSKTKDELQRILEEIQGRQEKATFLQSQYDSAVSSNEGLKTRIDNLQKELKEQLTVKEGLDKMYEECRPEIIEEQKQKNDELFSALFEKKEELRTLKEQYKKYEEERTNVTGAISETEKAIADIPEEIVMLREKYKELEVLLSELQNAETEYSQDKQMKLQEMINELIPIVEENRVAAEVLSNRWESLKKQDVEYNEEKHTLTTNLIELISSSMDDLKRHLKGYEEFLDATEKTADALAENIIRCQGRYEEYRNWYETSKTPLEAMIAGLEYPEYEDLRKILDVGQLPNVKKKFEDIRQNLQDIDYILARCAGAAQKDLQRIQRRTGQ